MKGHNDMQVVILAGGQKSMISRDANIPKPMLDLGGKPLLWHIMKRFSELGYNDFIICGGYKVDMIKEYFKDFYIYQSDITVDLKNNEITVHKKRTEDWNVTVVDTGLETATGKRIDKIEQYIDGQDFFVAFGDCLSDIDYNDMESSYRAKGKTAMVAVAHPTGRNIPFVLGREGEVLGKTDEKTDLFSEVKDDDSDNDVWTNACCYILNKKVFDILGEDHSLEEMLVKNLTKDGSLVTYKHNGFWSPVETLHDKVEMEKLWSDNKAPWMRVDR